MYSISNFVIQKQNTYISENLKIENFLRFVCMKVHQSTQMLGLLMIIVKIMTRRIMLQMMRVIWGMMMITMCRDAKSTEEIKNLLQEFITNHFPSVEPEVKIPINHFPSVESEVKIP